MSTKSLKIENLKKCHTSMRNQIKDANSIEYQEYTIQFISFQNPVNLVRKHFYCYVDPAL